MNALTICNTSVRQLDNLYSLNDLHKAAGNEDKHKPILFLRLDQSRELIAEVKGTDMHLLPIKVVKGRNGGTYACKELVYAYAMWISAAFMLQVIRVFDGVVNTQAPNLKTKKALPNGLSLDQCDSIKALVKARAEALPKEKQGAATTKLWSSVKSKFGCSYKEIPPEHFTEALSLVARVELEGEYLGKGDNLPAPQDLPPISVSNLMLDGLSKLTIKLPVDVESAVRQKALSMAMEAHGICLEHLLSSIAYSHQNEMARGSESGFYKAIKLVEDTNLDRALAHKFYEQLGSIKRQVENAKVLTNRYFDEICSALPKGLH